MLLKDHHPEEGSGIHLEECAAVQSDWKVTAAGKLVVPT